MAEGLRDVEILQLKNILVPGYHVALFHAHKFSHSPLHLGARRYLR